MRIKRQIARAFTLIELLVVIVILGILMAVALPTYLRQQSKAKDSNTEQQLVYAYHAIKSALPEYNNSYPATASVVTVIQQSEKELTVTSGLCSSVPTGTANTVVVAHAGSSDLVLCGLSTSGNTWLLYANATGHMLSQYRPVQTSWKVAAPTALWTLDETSGTAVTDNVGGDNGSYIGSPVLGATGLLPGDTAVTFNGSTSYAEMPYSAAANPSTPFSVEAWVKVNGGAGTWRSVITSRTATPNRGGYALYAGLADNWEFMFGYGSSGGSWAATNSAAPVTIGQWTHVVGSYDGQTIKIYINGVLSGQTTQLTPMNVNTNAPARIGVGATEGTPNYFCPCTIGEVAVYPYAMSATQVAADYAEGLGG